MQQPRPQKHFRINDTPLHPLQKIACIGVVLLIILTAFTRIVNTPSLFTTAEKMLSAVLPGVIVSLTNDERVKEDLAPLLRNTVLDEAARRKAEHMKQLDYFAHYSPQGISPWFWFDTVGYEYIYAGENLAVYFEDSDKIVKAWMESPLHKENILKKEYTEIGVAAVEGKHDGYNTVFVVQLFGTPQQKTSQKIPLLAQTDIITTTTTTTSTTKKTRSNIRGVQTNEQKNKVQSFEEATTLQEYTNETHENLPIIEQGKNVNSIPTTEIVERTNLNLSDHETTIEKTVIDGTPIFISDHASTSTVPNTIESTIPHEKRSVLLYVYVIILICTVILSIFSIITATMRRTYIQTLYGMALLMTTILLLSCHAYTIATATPLL